MNRAATDDAEVKYLMRRADQVESFREVFFRHAHREYDRTGDVDDAAKDPWPVVRIW